MINKLHKQIIDNLNINSNKSECFSFESCLQQLISELSILQNEVEIQKKNLLELEMKNKALKENYTNLFNTTPIGYFILNNNGRILDANHKAAHLLNIPKEHLVDRQFSKYISTETQKKI